MVTTAQKKGRVQPEHLDAATASMMALNKVGADLGALDAVHAMTDVTGFGLAGHGLEMARATGVDLIIRGADLPTLDRAGLEAYHEAGCIPGGTRRNQKSYGHDLVSEGGAFELDLLCDPQTSGGLLLAASASGREEVEAVLRANGCHTATIGEVVAGSGKVHLRP